MASYEEYEVRIKIDDATLADNLYSTINSIMDYRTLDEGIREVLNSDLSGLDPEDLGGDSQHLSILIFVFKAEKIIKELKNTIWRDFIDSCGVIHSPEDHELLLEYRSTVGGNIKFFELLKEFNPHIIDYRIECMEEDEEDYNLFDLTAEDF